MSYFKVTSRLSFVETEGSEIFFIGCDAKVVGETSSYLLVVFYTGLPFLISKRSFYAATEHQLKPEKEMDGVHDISLLQNGIQIKRFRGVWFENDPEYRSIKENALRWFNLTYGVHYDSISLELVNKFQKSIKTEKTMAKKVTETALSVFEEKASSLTLPEIPKVMVIGGVEFSEEAIRKEVEEVKKIKVEIPLDTDTVEVANAKKDNYDNLVKKKNQFVKTRTAPDKFRQEITKPINAWTKNLKAQTDSYGSIAKEGEEYCIEQIAVYDNWAEEQERIKREALDKLVSDRTADLQSLQGVMNRDSLHWTFPYAPNVIVEHVFIENASEEEWLNDINELKQELEAFNKKKEQEKAEFESTKNALYTTRLQMLQLVGGYIQNQDGSFSKNGHNISEEAIRSTPDTEWMNVVMSHNTPAESVNPFESKQTSTPAPGNPFGSPAPTSPQPEPEKETFVNPFAPAVEHKEEKHVVATPLFYEEKVSEKSNARLFRTEDTADALSGIQAKYVINFQNGQTVAIF